MEQTVERIQSEIVLIAGMVLLIIALLGTFFGLRIEVFIETGWRKHLEDLYIIKKDIYQPVYYINLSKIFRIEMPSKKNMINSGGQDNKIIIDQEIDKTIQKNIVNVNKDVTQRISEDQEFFSRGIVGINQLIKEILDSNVEKTGIELIQQGDKYLMLEHREEFITCIIANKRLYSLRYFLRKITNAFDMYYKSTSIDWENIGIDMLKSMDSIVVSILKG